MRYLAWMVLMALVLCPTAQVMAETADDGGAAMDMLVTSAGIIDGVLGDEYGKRGADIDKGMPTRSLPLSIANAPEGTVCFAVAMMDPDSEPLCGYPWVHWLATNIEGAEIAENASVDAAEAMVQGVNDFKKTGYGGPTPPDKTHTYVITVYALDALLELDDGFTRDEMLAAMDGHVLAEAELTGEYAK